MLTRRITTILLGTLLAGKLLVTAAEADPFERFGKQIEQTLANNHPGYLNSLFDLETFTKRVLADDTLNDDTDFIEGFRQGLLAGFDFGTELTGEIEQGAWYAFLNHYTRDSTHHLLFRFYSDNGLNYHDYELIKKEDKLLIADVYIYFAGENFSNTIRRIYKTYQLERAHPGTPPAKEAEYLRQLVKIQQIRNLLSEGNPKKAWRVFNTIPQGYQEEKPFQISKLLISSKLTPAMYLEALNGYQALFPNDPGLHLLSIDAFFANKEHSLAMKCLDSLERQVGHDPLLNLYRGNLNYAMGDTAGTIRCFENLLNELPTFGQAYLKLLDIYINSNRYPLAIGLLDKITGHFQLTKEDLKQSLAGYPKFIGSAEFKQWIEY